ncbi:MAG: DUF2017 domain-containing protein [Trebonia sp.]
MFRPIKDGGVSVWLSAGEAQLLRTLVVPVMELLTDDRERHGAGESTGSPAGTAAQTPEEAAVFDELERLFDDVAPETPDDPVLARLLPDAYQDDPKAADEFRKYTESSLREAKKYFAQTLLDTLPAHGGRVKLTGDQARDWMRALNDIRLSFGVRLDVTEDFEEQLTALDPEDPKFAAFEVYGWLGAVQESLVQALA